MANGIIELTRFGNAANATLYGRMLWSSEPNGTEKNTSTVTVQVQLKRPVNSWMAGTWKGVITIGGNSFAFSQYLRVESEWITVASATATVNHNPDGNCACYLDCKVNGPGGTSMEGSYVSGSATVALDTIPRYASLKAIGDFTDEEDPKITYSNPAGAAVSSLQVCVSLDGKTEMTAYQDVPKTGTEYTVALTATERNALLAAAPDSNTLQVYFLLKTVIGNGSHVEVNFANMGIVNADPVVSVAVEDTNSTICGITGNPSILVALHSTAKVTVYAAAQKYAAIKRKKVEHGTQTLADDGTLAVTNNPIKITVTDSRGNETVKIADNSVVPYINPTCLIGNNIPEADGTFSLVASGQFYNGKIGKTTNTLTVQYRYKPAGGSYGDWIAFESVTKSGNGYTATANLTGLDYQTVYTFQVRAVDAIHPGGIYSAEKAVISQPVFDWGQNDFKFNVPVYDKTGAQIGNSETQWQNPPVASGVEYCTTERWDSKPVYRSMINIGALPNSSFAEIAHGLSATHIVRCEGVSNYGFALPMVAATNRVDLGCSKTHIYVTTTADYSYAQAYVTIYYTKS